MAGTVQNADGSTPIAVTSSALPTGAATSAAQTTGNASLASIDGKIVAVDTGAVVIASGTVAVTGPLTDAQLRAVAVPVSGTVTASGPLTDTQLRATAVPVSGTVAVTGSATAANQATEIASLASIDGKITAVDTGAVVIASGSVTANLGTIAGVSTAAKQPALGTAGTASTDVITVQGIAAMTPLLATLSGTNNIATVTAVTAISSALPAGNNNIGDVDVATLPALVAGTANIGDVDVLTVPADPFGVNADAASATGSISAKLRFIAATGIPVTSGTITTVSTVTAVTAITNALPAGTNAIGKLAANSGVDIGDVDVTSLPAIPAGTNLIGKTAASNETSTVYEGTTALTPKFAIIDAASSGDNTLVASVSSKKIRVLSAFLVSAGTVTVRFESGAGGTALTGQMNLIANTGFVLPYSPVGWFETAATTLLNLELSGAISVDGSLTYVEAS